MLSICRLVFKLFCSPVDKMHILNLALLGVKFAMRHWQEGCLYNLCSTWKQGLGLFDVSDIENKLNIYINIRKLKNKAQMAS